MRATYLGDVLALELRDELADALLVSLDTDGVKQALDVGSRGGGVAAKAKEHVSCDVLHFDEFLFELVVGRPQIR